MTRKTKSHEPYVNADGTRSLDWSDSSHYCKDSARCRYCNGFTILRDSNGQPSHKVCAETNDGT